MDAVGVEEELGVFGVVRHVVAPEWKGGLVGELSRAAALADVAGHRVDEADAARRLIAPVERVDGGIPREVAVPDVPDDRVLVVGGAYNANGTKQEQRLQASSKLHRQVICNDPTTQRPRQRRETTSESESCMSAQLQHSLAAQHRSDG